MTLAVFHDFPGVENGLTKFHDFPGRVVTLCNACSLDPPNSAWQTASQSVQQFSQSSRQGVRILYSVRYNAINTWLRKLITAINAIKKLIVWQPADNFQHLWPVPSSLSACHAFPPSVACCRSCLESGFLLVGVLATLMPENYAGMPKFGMPGVHCMLKAEQLCITGCPKIVTLASGGLWPG